VRKTDQALKSGGAQLQTTKGEQDAEKNTGVDNRHSPMALKKLLQSVHTPNETI
jgi:hypothetical protein